MWLTEKQTDVRKDTHTGHFCLYPGTETKVAISPVHVFVPSTPQLLALKKMPVAGGSRIKGSTRLLYRELKRFTQFFWGPEPIFFLFFWHYPQCVCPKDKQRRRPPQLYLLKGKHSCLSCILRRNTNERDQTKISKGRKVFTA